MRFFLNIDIPTGWLQGILFDVGRPSSLNFGALGVIAGHELGHGFDNKGARYDSTGALKNWWSHEAKNNFDEKAECFKKQYSSFKDEQTGLQLNGNITF